jgi:HEPN domain-containing protein
MRLVEEATSIVNIPGDLVERIKRLDRYYILIRYPNG